MGEINSQLEAKSIILTEGRINIIDATPIEVAQSGSGKDNGGQPKRDRQAGWHVKKDIAVGILNPPMAIWFTRVLTGTVSSNAKQSLRVMCMTASSATHSCRGDEKGPSC